MLHQLCDFSKVLIESTFNTETRELASLCKRNHDYMGTGMSLRAKNKSHQCVECQKLTRNEWRKLDHVKEKEQAYRKEYQSRPEVLQARREYKQTEAQKAKARERKIKNRDKINECRRKCRAAKREHYREMDRKWWEANKDQINERRRRHSLTEQGRLVNSRKKHKYRAKKKAQTFIHFSNEELQSHIEKFNSKCCYCKRKVSIDNRSSWHLDHFIPIDFGGTDVLSNLVVACPSCNLSKRNHDPYEWFQSQSFFSATQWNRILKYLGKKPKEYALIPFI